MNHDIHSMARITAQRAIFDAGEYYPPKLSLKQRHLRRLAFVSFTVSLVAFYWLAGVM